MNVGMPLVWPPPSNSDHQTNYYHFSRGIPPTKKKCIHLPLESWEGAKYTPTPMVCQEAYLKGNQKKSPPTGKKKKLNADRAAAGQFPPSQSPGRSGAFREVRGVKDVMAKGHRFRDRSTTVSRTKVAGRV